MSKHTHHSFVHYYQMSRLFDAAVLTASYAKFRPQPPPSVISRIIQYVKESLLADHLSLAVDVGCGSGQVYKDKQKLELNTERTQ